MDCNKEKVQSPFTEQPFPCSKGVKLVYAKLFFLSSKEKGKKREGQNAARFKRGMNGAN